MKSFINWMLFAVSTTIHMACAMLAAGVVFQYLGFAGTPVMFFVGIGAPTLMGIIDAIVFSIVQG